MYAVIDMDSGDYVEGPFHLQLAAKVWAKILADQTGRSYYVVRSIIPQISLN